MDFSNLKEQVSNMTLYDLKAGVRKVQNGKFESRWIRVHYEQTRIGLHVSYNSGN
jgi:hypothetical protein